MIAGLRSFFAIPIMLAVVKGRKDPNAASPYWTLRHRYSWIAAVAYAVMVIAFVFAAKYTTVASAIFIQYTGPIYVAVLSVPLLGERISRGDLLAVCGCTFGMALFFRDDLDAGQRLGNIIAIVSSFGFAALPLAIRYEQRALSDQARSLALSPTVAMALGNALTFLVALPEILRHPPTRTHDWVVLALLGTLQIGLPYVLYGAAVSKLKAIESSLVAMLEPIVSPLWAFLLFAEVPGKWARMGAVVILFSLAVQAWLGRRGESARTSRV